MALLLGLDYGRHHIGMAIADDEEGTAVGAGTLRVRSMNEAIRSIRAAVAERGIKKIVVGLPLSLKSQDTPQTSETRSFLAALRVATGLPVDAQDERLTSRQAERAGATRATVDEKAAILLLQAYCDRAAHARRQSPAP